MADRKVNTALDWLRSAKNRFRAFAYGDEKERTGQPRVGLALAGGFARGIAHIGVLRVLEHAGIPIDYVAGTSVGALIGAAFCSGVSPEQMEAIGRETSFADFGRWTPKVRETRLPSDRFHLLRRHARAERRANQSANARSCHIIDRNPRMLEHSQHTDVCNAARKSTR